MDLRSLVSISNWKPRKNEKGLYIVEGTFSGTTDGVLIGIDPGVNFGMTILGAGVAVICHGKLVRREHSWDHGVDAYDLVKTYTHPWYGKKNVLAVVEGAAYHKKLGEKESYGQVGLESVRFGFYLGLLHNNLETVVAAPATIRMGALGDGRAGAFDVWPLLNHNAADSLGAALYAYNLRSEN